ncbi:hypothetical protein TWF694_008895 [Orbilia ellipsospora]|uniref:Uncharacterized protein n=1 Tax=Orbilia ellipsospora TaxID=2528407 RepID=A0AAV9XD87_9PEZI
MQSLARTAVISALVMKAYSAAVTAGATCPGVWNPACGFLCPYNGANICSSVWSFDPNNGACSVCPSVPSVCPLTASASCAYLCRIPSYNLGPFCYPTAMAVFTGNVPADCTPCGGNPAIPSVAAQQSTTPAQSVSTIPVPVSSAAAGGAGGGGAGGATKSITTIPEVAATQTLPAATATGTPDLCPTSYTASCAFLCPQAAGKGAYINKCATTWTIGANDVYCSACPGVPTTCPSTPSASCNYLCKPNGLVVGPWCYAAPVSMIGTAEATCTPCGAGAGTSAGGVGIQEVSSSTATAVAASTETGAVSVSDAPVSASVTSAGAGSGGAGGSAAPTKSTTTVPAQATGGSGGSGSGGSPSASGGSGGEESGPSASGTSPSVSSPTESSGASALAVGGAGVVGLLCMMLNL